MSASKGKPVPPANTKNQTQSKKGAEVKPAKKEWSAEDYVSATVPVEEVR
jgi:hypothetical protein